MHGRSVDFWGRGPPFVGRARTLVGCGPSSQAVYVSRYRLAVGGAQLAAFAPKNGRLSVETPTADGAREREPVVVIFVPSEGR